MRALFYLALVGCLPPEPEGFSAEPPAQGAPYPAFANPEPVAIRGYSGIAMEPFLTRDGAYLLFNNSNDAAVDTNLQLARRVDDITFDYISELTGADSHSLDGVPTVAGDGTMYFVSTRAYDDSLSTIFSGTFAAEAVSNVTLLTSISRHQPLLVNFDVEVSADGNDLYFVDAGVTPDGVPQHADLVLATRDSTGTFVRRPDSEELLANVNSTALEYAAGISSDELELYFTRVPEITADAMPTIYRAARTSVAEPFGVPQHVEAAAGFVEGPTLSSDGSSLYYHRCVQGSCSIYRVSRISRFGGSETPVP